MKYPSTFQSKKYPKFIRQSKFLKSISTTTKVFPKIGLSNCSVKLKDLKLASADIFDYLDENYKLCFSSNGKRGVWDLATMGMRGVSSCMKWKSKQSRSLIGTIVDPYVGMIYLSDDTKTKYGSRILARALIRLIVDKRKGKLRVFIEDIYYDEKLSFQADDFIDEIFLSWMKRKLPTIKIMSSADDYSCSRYFIPVSKNTKQILKAKQSKYLSYRDSGLGYKLFPKFYDPDKFNLNVKKK